MTTQYPLTLSMSQLPTRGSALSCRAVLQASTGTVSEDLRFDPQLFQSTLAEPSLAKATDYLVTTLADQAPELCRVLRSDLEQSGGDASLELKLEGKLQSLPWESALRDSRLVAPDSAPKLVRLTEGRAETRPSELPWNVLWTDAAKSVERSAEPPVGLKYYRATLSHSPTLEALSSLTSSQNFDIVHFSNLGARFSKSRGKLQFGPTGEEATAAGLAKTFRQTPPRLLVLEGEEGTFAPLLDLGHQLSEKLGSAVLVLEPADVDQARAAAEDLYRNLAQDHPLDQLAFDIQGTAALIGPRGADDLMRLSTTTGALRSRQSQLRELSQRRMNDLQVLLSEAKQRASDSRFIERLQDTYDTIEDSLVALDEAPIDYDRARGIPGQRRLVDTAARVDASTAALEQARVGARVVNTCLLESGTPLAPFRDVLAGEDYRVEVQIGAPSERSNNRDRRPIPEDQLERFMSEDGVELRAVLSSGDFVVHETEKPITLPPRPRESKPQVFRVTAPKEPGIASLYILLYYKQNLIQALHLQAHVVETRRGRGKGNWTETIWMLSGRLEIEDLDKLPERTLNVFADGASGRPYTIIFGEASWRASARLPDQKLNGALSKVRKRLIEVSEKLYGKSGDKIKDNRPDLETFEKELFLLARSGRQLHQALIPERDHRRKLQPLLLTRQTLQIANARTLEAAFPWALVYDRPAVGELRLCPEFRSAVERTTAPVRSLEALPCFAAVCPSHHDKSVVCPSGFWGFRHILEQPLSQNDDDEMPRIQRLRKDVSMLMIGNAGLKFFDVHSRSLDGLPQVRLTGPFAAKKDLFRELARSDLQVVYFYCHGVRTEALATVLELGRDKKEYFYPSELVDLEIQWRASRRPLVFVNGCHTLDTTPEDLVSFNGSFRECGAAGVVGTEIDVTEYLATASAKEFFSCFVAQGANLGEATRHLRLWLLGHRNPLGLVYTPYGHTDLQLSEAA